jgi:hypothetical protein
MGAGGAESKDPVERLKAPEGWDTAQVSTGLFTAHRPTTKARADAPFRMTFSF